jgi:hypothetical protein
MLSGIKNQLKNLLRMLVESYQPFKDAFTLYLRFRRFCLFNRSPSDSVVIYRIDSHGLANFDQVCLQHSADIRDLPETLILDSGKYCFRGVVCSCCKPGLYRFSAPGIKNQQSIVLEQSDPVASALYLSMLSIRGNRDEKYITKHLRRYASQRLVSLTCGPNARFVHEIMLEHGFRSRVVYSHTLEELNSYNDGHALLEVYKAVENKYVVIDVDKKLYFSFQDAQLSLFELCSLIYQGKKISLHKIFDISAVDWGGFKGSVTGFDYAFIEQGFYFNNESTISCLSRICQVPMMFDDDRWYVCAWDDVAGERLREINAEWNLLSSSDFLQKFYLS